MNRLPDFVIIGAMKCATSTLHEQLAKQPNIFMSEPKELYFFSDDPVYAKGINWYANHFAQASADALCGESTTHYTKLPTYPQTIERIQKHLPNARFIYIMRHPVERLVSQYIHQWTEREITIPIDQAIAQHGELIAYSQYTYQLEPWFKAFGKERILPVFFDRLKASPQQELNRVSKFIGYQGAPLWDYADEKRNVSAERMRVDPVRDAILNLPVLTDIRKRLIPQSLRDRVKGLWQMNKRPELSAEQEIKLKALFDRDLVQLGSWLGAELTCDNFKAVTRDQTLDWVEVVR